VFDPSTATTRGAAGREQRGRITLLLRYLPEHREGLCAAPLGTAAASTHPPPACTGNGNSGTCNSVQPDGRTTKGRNSNTRHTRTQSLPWAASSMQPPGGRGDRAHSVPCKPFDPSGPPQPGYAGCNGGGGCPEEEEQGGTGAGE
ncbi:hypothetical protein Agub_g13838, partial [Astrephomene gubernaculifera]